MSADPKRPALGHERPTFLVRNQMPKRLEMRGTATGRTLKLAPLQTVRVYDRPNDFLGDSAMHALTDRAVAWEREPVRSTRVWVTAWLVLLAAASVAAGLTLLIVDGQRWAWAAVGLFVLAALGLGGAGRMNRPREEDYADPVTDEVGQRLTGWRFIRDVSVSALQKLSLVIVLLVGILGPTAAIYYGSELYRVVEVTGWGAVRLSGEEADYPVIVARLLQIMLVVILALIPALMYFQFDREKLTTLIDRWMHHAFRMDPTLKTISDVDAKYGRRVEEFYGASFDTGVTTGRKRSSTRSPLYVTTLLLGVSWIVVLLNDTRETGNIQELIQPSFTPMTCAFLGAYFFAVQVVLLGYVRGDLRPKTYNVVTVRIIVAVIIAWMLQALWGTGAWVLAASFLAGIVPETVLRWVRDFGGQVQHRTIGRWLAGAHGAAADAPVEEQGERPQPSPANRPDQLDELEDRSPLIALDGIGIYERTRLAEEGITSIQALATHDLVDLMLSTRIPAARLIDWIDQALLYQHVTAEDLVRLRRSGVRTATQLLAAGRRSPVKEVLASLLDDGSQRLPVILQALCHDEWLAHVRNWREHDDTQEPGRVIYTDQGLQPTPTRGGNGSRARGREAISADALQSLVEPTPTPATVPSQP
jgi:predicted flap endonuclease-1-like 5' DNA nuclease